MLFNIFFSCGSMLVALSSYIYVMDAKTYDEGTIDAVANFLLSSCGYALTALLLETFYNGEGKEVPLKSAVYIVILAFLLWEAYDFIARSGWLSDTMNHYKYVKSLRGTEHELTHGNDSLYDIAMQCFGIFVFFSLSYLVAHAI